MGTLICLKCRNPICSLPEMALLESLDGGIHCILKPPYDHVLARLVVTDMEKPNKRDFHRIQCPNGHKLGKITMIRDPVHDCAFSVDYVALLDRAGREVFLDRKKGKWKGLLSYPGLALIRAQASAAPCLPPPCTSSATPLVIPTLADLEPFAPPSLGDYPRDYQVELFTQGLRQNSIIFLPTGAGKTCIAALLAYHLLRANPRRVAVMVVPRVPLVFQQAAYIEEQTGLRVLRLCGELSSPATAQQIAAALRGQAQPAASSGGPSRPWDVLVCTAQLFWNLLEAGAISFGEIALLCFDEAHHCHQENHPAARVITHPHFRPDSPVMPRVLGLTATPCSSGAIGAALGELHALSARMHAVVVAPRLFRPPLLERTSAVEWHMPGRTPAERAIEDLLVEYLQRDLLCQIRGRMDATPTQPAAPLPGLPWLLSLSRSPAPPPFDLRSNPLPFFQYLALCEKILDQDALGRALLDHARALCLAVELNGCVGPTAALDYWRGQVEGVRQSAQLGQLLGPVLGALMAGVAAAIRQQPSGGSTDEEGGDEGEGLLLSGRCRTLIGLLQSLIGGSPAPPGQPAQTPHLAAQYVDEDLRVILFVQRRETARRLCDALARADVVIQEALNPTPIVGRQEMWVDEQQALLERFRVGESKLLVCTSVCEEGLDVPQCSVVVRFDPPRSARTLVQSRGRARRLEEARLVMIVEPDQRARFEDILRQQECMPSVIQALAAACAPSRPLVEELIARVQRCQASRAAPPLTASAAASPGSRAGPPGPQSSPISRDAVMVELWNLPPRTTEADLAVLCSPLLVRCILLSRASSGALHEGDDAHGDDTHGEDTLGLGPSPSRGEEDELGTAEGDVEADADEGGDQQQEGAASLDLGESPLLPGFRPPESFTVLAPGRARISAAPPWCLERRLSPYEFALDMLLPTCLPLGSQTMRGAWATVGSLSALARQYQRVHQQLLQGGDPLQQSSHGQPPRLGGLELAACSLGHFTSSSAFVECTGPLPFRRVTLVPLERTLVLQAPPAGPCGEGDELAMRVHISQVDRLVLVDYRSAAGEGVASVFVPLRHPGACFLVSRSPSGQEEALTRVAPPFLGHPDGNVLRLQFATAEAPRVGAAPPPLSAALLPLVAGLLGPLQRQGLTVLFFNGTTASRASRASRAMGEDAAPAELLPSWGVLEDDAGSLEDPSAAAWADPSRVCGDAGLGGTRPITWSGPTGTQGPSLELPLPGLHPDLAYWLDALAGCARMPLSPLLRGPITQHLGPCFSDPLWRPLVARLLSQCHQALRRDRWIWASGALAELCRYCALLGRIQPGPAAPPGDLHLGDPVPAHCALVKRALVTPSRVVVLPPQVVATNRVLRQYPQAAGHFLLVAFRDEDGRTKLSASQADLAPLLARVVAALRHGLPIGGRTYELLAYSSSQLRIHGAWFFTPQGPLTAATIRGGMGDFSRIRCVAKCAARMGMAFSTSVDTVALPAEPARFGEIVARVPDIERSGFCFSDGCGAVSPALARIMWQGCIAGSPIDIGAHAPPPADEGPHRDDGPSAAVRVPSAFQIRMGGVKGVVATDPTLGPGLRLAIRESMYKFDSPHRRLEVLNHSRRLGCFLNRQVIVLLSALGVPDGAFLELQEEMLDRCARLFTDEQVALQGLRQLLAATADAKRAGCYELELLQRGGVQLTVEPFFRGLLEHLYQSLIGDLVGRSRIQVPRGAVLMGVLDETGLLEPGQIHVRLSGTLSGLPQDPVEGQSQGSPQVCTVLGPCAVAKNPCFHPGDLRVFTAVECPALEHLVDVVVFPQRGPRPHPNELSGSDLDGDLYFVTWEPRLLPPRQADPADYTAPPSQQLDRPVEQADLARFFANYIANDRLGIIANAHLAFADEAPEGAFCPQCLTLGVAGVGLGAHQGGPIRVLFGSPHLHSVAVDFPKTGVPALIPKDCQRNCYPAFMGKADRPSFESGKIIDLLFQRCRVLQAPADPQSTLYTVAPMAGLRYPGYREWLPEARRECLQYQHSLAGLMAAFDTASQAEAVTGVLRSRAKNESPGRSAVREASQRMAQELRRSTRAVFFAQFGGEQAWDRLRPVVDSQPDAARAPAESLADRALLCRIMAKAAAWYAAAYGCSDMDEPDKSGRASSDAGDAGDGDDDDADGVADGPEDETAEADPAGLHRSCTQALALSFPWVLDDVLAVILSQAGRPAPQVQPPFASRIGASIQRSLSAEHLGRLREEFATRRRLVGALEAALGSSLQPRLHLTLFGSTAGMLFEEESDLDVYLSPRPWGTEWPAPPPRESQAAFLRSLAEVLAAAPGLGSAGPSSLTSPRMWGGPPEFKEARVPIVTLRWGLAKATALSVDLTADPRGCQKAALFRAALAAEPRLWALAVTVRRWAAELHLFGHGALGLLSPHSFVTLLLHFLAGRGALPPLDTLARHPAPLSDSDEDAFWARILGRGPLDDAGASWLGQQLCDFFGWYQAPDRLRECRDPVDGTPTLPADCAPSEVAHLARAFFEARHRLLRSLDVQQLQPRGTARTHRLFLKFTPSTLFRIPPAVTADLLSRVAAVRVRCARVHGGMAVVFRASAHSPAPRLIGDYLRQASTNVIRWRFPRGSRKGRFLTGAYRLLLDGLAAADRGAPLVTFRPYPGPRHPQHHFYPLYFPLLARPASGLASPDASREAFVQLLVGQLDAFARGYRGLEQHGKATWRLHFGTCYMFNLPAQQTRACDEAPGRGGTSGDGGEPISIEAIEDLLERGHKRPPPDDAPVDFAPAAPRLRQDQQHQAQQDQDQEQHPETAPAATASKAPHAGHLFGTQARNANRSSRKRKGTGATLSFDTHIECDGGVPGVVEALCQCGFALCKDRRYTSLSFVGPLCDAFPAAAPAIHPIYPNHPIHPTHSLHPIQVLMELTRAGRKHEFRVMLHEPQLAFHKMTPAPVHWSLVTVRPRPSPSEGALLNPRIPLAVPIDFRSLLTSRKQFKEARAVAQRFPGLASLVKGPVLTTSQPPTAPTRPADTASGPSPALLPFIVEEPYRRELYLIRSQRARTFRRPLGAPCSEVPANLRALAAWPVDATGLEAVVQVAEVQVGWGISPKTGRLEASSSCVEVEVGLRPPKGARWTLPDVLLRGVANRTIAERLWDLGKGLAAFLARK
ncbi:putative RNA-dependent RNA polymerase 1 [Paratrimastix pyriformis]|uniref:RNA-directed RNA polymerase n=1 Tax=Paratrimastix pyriformis TaxID=342808 RepID=A0ABQ8UGW8_9EUKA|nr:putative RNA-dependent RNA polymerase 1 [Paratrimastix pyriformis]